MQRLRRAVQKVWYIWGPLAVVIVLTVSLYGIYIPRDLDIYTKSGWFVLRPYKYGVYITQPNTGVFYNFSPYDAYFQSGTDTPEKMLKIEPGANSEIISNESQLLKDDIKTPISAVYAVLSYFGRIDPAATFVKDGKTTIFTGKLNNGYATLNVVRNELNPQNGRDLYLALSYNEDDFLLDENGNLLVQKETQNIEDINKIYGKLLILNGPVLQPADYERVNKLTIFNKSLNGSLSIETSDPNFKFVTIDTTNKLIYFKSLNNSKPLLKIRLFDSFPEALGK